MTVKWKCIENCRDGSPLIRIYRHITFILFAFLLIVSWNRFFDNIFFFFFLVLHLQFNAIHTTTKKVKQILFLFGMHQKSNVLRVYTAMVVYLCTLSYDEYKLKNYFSFRFSRVHLEKRKQWTWTLRFGKALIVLFFQCDLPHGMSPVYGKFLVNVVDIILWMGFSCAFYRSWTRKNTQKN